MNDRDRIEELAALAAAGALTGTERAELDAMAAGDAEVRALVREYGDAASLMALALDEPPPPLRVLESVRQRVRGRTPAPGVPVVERPASAGVVPIERARRGKPSPAMVAAVVVPLAAAAAFALLWLRERGVVDDVAGKLAGMEKRLDDSQTKLDESLRRERLSAGAMVAAQKKVEQLEGSLQTVATPHLELATVKQPKQPTQPNQPVIKVLVDPENRRWVVMAFDLPPIPSDKDYQLWFLGKKDAPPVSAGLLAPGPGNTQFGTISIPANVTNIKGAAISLEPKGGSKTPTEVKAGGPFI